MADKKTIDDILRVYNSIHPSRTRWVRNRNNLRNQWQELFEALELASGRDGYKLAVYDPNWHMVDNSDGMSSTVNRETPLTDSGLEIDTIPLPAEEAPTEESKQLDIEEETKKVEAKKAPAKKSSKK